jgi:hypothetical protein
MPTAAYIYRRASCTLSARWEDEGSETVQSTRPSYVDFKVFSDDLWKMQALKDQLLADKERRLGIGPNSASDSQGTEQISQLLN